MSDQTQRDDAAMADILASIRRIVTDEQKQGGAARRAAADGDLLELTPEMRIDGGAAAPAARPAPAMRAPEAGPKPTAPQSAPSRPAAPAASFERASVAGAAGPRPATRPGPPEAALQQPAAQRPQGEGAPVTDGAESDGADSGRADSGGADAGAADAGGFSIDEAAVADIARAVMRQEFSGAFGRSLTQQIRQLISAEVSRALAAERRARDQ